jgi:hypothetical protein
LYTGNIPAKRLLCKEDINRVPTVRGKSGKNDFFFKVMEKSGNFKIKSQGKMRFWKKVR